MNNADKWVHPTKFTGEYPNWNGYTWLDWTKQNAFHPGDDYNFGYGNNDLGQDVVSTAAGVVFHTSETDTGYGKLVIIKHTLGYILKRFIKETYGIETDIIYTLYAHLDDIVVKTGQIVDCGEIIGHVGNTGTKWAHLHFEIYHLEKELKHVSERFYPTGWSKEKIKDNWLPAYKFIEATKMIDSLESFLGKPRAYWEQVEKDRESLLKQIGEKDAEFAKLLSPVQLRVQNLLKENKQLEEELAKTDDKKSALIDQHKKAINKRDEIIKQKEEALNICKIRKTEILSEQSEKLKAGETFIMFVQAVKRIWIKK